MKCTICDSKKLKYLDTFVDMPIHIGTTSAAPIEDAFMDQVWAICADCGCIQLHTLLDPTILYSNSHNPGTTGNTWSRHHRDFGMFVAQHMGENLIEVGAGTDRLARNIHGYKPWSSYTIIDPLVQTSLNVVPITVVRALFGVDFNSDLGLVDTIIHSHTMEHFYDVSDTVKLMAELLPTGGKMIVSIPLINEVLRGGHHNGLNFEHTYMTSKTNLEFVLGRHGLTITHWTYFNPLNVFFCAEKCAQTHGAIAPQKEVDINVAIFQEYTRILGDKYLRILEHLESSLFKPTFMFGAHVFSQVPLTIVPELIPHITAIIDNDPLKQEKRLYGVRGLPVFSSEIIRNIHSPRVIVDAAQYTTEIVSELIKINPNVEIL